jgi:hypothetical protein
MISTEEGIQIDCSADRNSKSPGIEEKASSPRIDTWELLSNATVERHSHHVKHSFEIMEIDAGTQNDSIDLQPSRAASPKVVTLEGLSNEHS